MIHPENIILDIVPTLTGLLIVHRNLISRIDKMEKDIEEREKIIMELLSTSARLDERFQKVFSEINNIKRILRELKK